MPSPKMQEVSSITRTLRLLWRRIRCGWSIKNLFVNTDSFDCVVLVEKDGHLLREADLETHVAPLSEEVYELPVSVQTLPGEYAVTVSFRLREDTLWAKRGHEVASDRVCMRFRHLLRCTGERWRS